ncbi:hypothetical protein [Marinifilum sp.]|uniref:hypothetical protein n=1 Tax=Marinifilum sp. TaxID=2033137 RepID=UPI003BAA2565
MIRVFKQEEVPASLQKDGCNKHDGQDVQDALYEDQYNKCYLSEQYVGKDSEIEHLRPQALFPGLKYEWTNLFLVSPYCNGRKENSLVLLDPTQHNIEDIIEQRLNIGTKNLEFVSIETGKELADTIALLDKLHNGKKGLRDRKTKAFYDDVEFAVSNFLRLLNKYKENPSDQNRLLVSESLQINKEFLGLKYWMIKDNGFEEQFQNEIIWNKI